MLDGPDVVSALEDCGVTHVVWIPDSDLGRWQNDLENSPQLRLVRACREGEAIAVAAGLILGGQKPIVCMQCTGFFEAGDTLRNVVHDLHLPLFTLIGVRSYFAHQQGKTRDSAPVFTEPILQAWQIPYTILTENHTAQDLAKAWCEAQEEKRAGAVLYAE